MAALEVVPPGHRVPEGCVATSEQVIDMWMFDIHEDWADEPHNYHEVLKSKGVKNLYDLAITESEMVEWGIPIMAARRIKVAADAVMRSLGMPPRTELGPAVGPTGSVPAHQHPGEAVIEADGACSDGAGADPDSDRVSWLWDR